MKIYVDADACPVVRIVEKLAKKYEIPCTLLCDTNHVLNSEYSEVIIVGAGADAVDFKLISLFKRSDICVSQDYGVAAMALGKGCFAIHQSGKWYTNENIDQMLMERHLAKKARRSSKKNHLKGCAGPVDQSGFEEDRSTDRSGAEREWIMHGMDWDDPFRIRTPRELINYINQVGFLPLFANEVPGFSVEDHVSDLFWWSGDPEQDPWVWREIIARTGEVAYGKFFNRKAGFVSLKWFPAFANYLRDGYDFDARWEDELTSHRAKKIVDLFEENEELYSFEIKKKAGFGKEGEKNFEGVITDLQMQGYLVVRDFRRRKRKKDGVEYGWPMQYY